MKPFFELRDKDIFKEDVSEKKIEYKLRVAVKGFLMDDDGKFDLISRSIQYKNKLCCSTKIVLEMK